MPRHQPIVTLLLTLALTLTAAPAAAPKDRAPATHTSPSGRYHLRSHDAAAQPGALTPAEPGAGEQNAEARQTLELTETGRPPFIITAAEGRCTPHWSADEAFLALAIQTDRATFSLLILRLSDRKSITCDFTALDQQRLQLFQKAGLDASASALQLTHVRCTSQQCTGQLVTGTAHHTGTLTFAIDLPQAPWSATGTPIHPRLTATQLKPKPTEH